MKRPVFLDNDGTFTVFNNTNFNDTIKDDLNENIAEYVSKELDIKKSEAWKIMNDLKKDGKSWSAEFEKMGLDRSKYFYETRKNLQPEKYIQPRNLKELDDIVSSDLFHTIMLTAAPKVRFENVISYIGREKSDFDEVYTAEDFYSKSEFIKNLSEERGYEPTSLVAVGDQEGDFRYVRNVGGIGLDINSKNIITDLQSILSK